MRINWTKVLLWIVSLEFIGFLLGQVTQNNIDSWYNAINKSHLTPPSIVFSIVWPIMYVILAFIGYFLWSKRQDDELKMSLYVYAVQLVMNWTWTLIFFQLHLIGLSFFWLLVLCLLTLALIYNLKSRYSYISFMLTPYFLWLLFALYLNGFIWISN
jgi:tryptophan-rich sensory protein